MGLVRPIRMILCFVCFLFLVNSQNAQKEPSCGRAKSCSECMGIRPACSWCSADEFDDTKEGPGFRCAPSSVLLARGCPQSSIEDVESVLLDHGVPLDQASLTEDIQLTPRSQSVKVRPGGTMMVNFTFQSISDYPVDLYFLTDLSYTMIDDLETVSRLTNDIVLTMRNVTKKLQMGFGAFVDKPVFPFVVPTPEYLRNPCLNVGTKNLHCDPPFLYKHILSLTDNFEEFREKTKVARPSGNLDSPEGGMDALLQVARCSEAIGWRAGARKIVLFASDGGFHLAGDGRIAGLILPPPTTCQLTYQADRFNSSLKYLGWHNSDQTDYPSVGEIAQVLTEADISVIFAVDSKLHGLYTKLAEFLPSAAVGILTDSSTNIVRLLRDNYDKIVNKAELMATYDADYLEVQVFSKCNDENEFSKKTVCNDHPVGGKIGYQISIKAKRCFEGVKKVTLKMVALEDQAVLGVQTACSCPSCEKMPMPSSLTPFSARCQLRGHLHCGECKCQSGYSGDFCECSSEASAEGDAAMLAQCTEYGVKEPCSGRGRCVCGKCKCNLARYEGTFCECDRHGCKRASDDNQVCGGPQRGTCQCNGTCECKPGYTGDRCDCMESEKQCIDPNNPSGPKCSGRGVCDCGQCFCNSGYTGHLCNEIQGGESALCTDRDVEKCVLCLRDSLVKSFDLDEKLKNDEMTKTDSESEDESLKFNQRQPISMIYSSKEYALAATQCESSCNGTVVDTSRVKLVEASEQKDDSNLCIIYTEDNCRVFFTYRYSDAIYVNRKILKHCTRINQTLSQCRYYQCTQYIGKNQIRDLATESLKNVLSDTVINKNCTDEEKKCSGKSSVYRFVPSKPIWKRFDVGVQHELEDVNGISGTKDCASPDNQDIFCIDHSALPKRTHLDMNVVKLLEQVSLINFKEENLRILEEAIRYADSLLTKEAFHGTTNNQCWSIDNTEPMISSCDEINVGFNWFLGDDNRDNHIVYNCNLATDIMQQVPDKWEGYIVAPLGNIPVEQNESSEVQGVTV